jgi:hypothetical protein
MSPKREKVPVSMRAVIARVNRALKPNDEKLKVTRGDRWRHELGDYYVVNWSRNWIVNKQVDPEEMARELKVLQEWERVVEEEAS